MLALLLVSVSPLLVTAAVEQPAEISDEDLKSINKANDLSLKWVGEVMLLEIEYLLNHFDYHFVLLLSI